MLRQTVSKRSQKDQPIRWAMAAAGLIGAAGVAAAAAAAHGSDARLLGPASVICLANAPALLVLGVTGSRLRLGRICAALLLLGTVLFAGDLALRSLVGRGLFPMAAPTGGMAMFVAWLTITFGAFLPRRRE